MKAIPDHQKGKDVRKGSYVVHVLKNHEMDFQLLQTLKKSLLTSICYIQNQ